MPAFPDSPEIRLRGRQGTAALVLLRLYGNAFKDRSGAFSEGAEKKEPSAKRGIPLPFLRKAGAKVHRLFHTTKSFCKFFQKIMKKEQKTGENGLSVTGKGLPTTGKGLSTRRKGLSLQEKGRLTQNETFEKR